MRKKRKKIFDRFIFDHRLHCTQEVLKKNVYKFVHKTFLLAEKIFNIVIGNFYFLYLLTHIHISPRNCGGFLFVANAVAIEVYTH